MSEFVVATRDIYELREKLALAVISRKVIEITIATSDSTKPAWFYTQSTGSNGGDEADGETFFGLASDSSDDPRDMTPAVINTENRMLILSMHPTEQL